MLGSRPLSLCSFVGERTNDTSFHRSVHHADWHCMDHLQKLLIVVLAGLLGGPAWAVYVNPAAPAGVSAGGADFAGLMAKPSLLGGEMSGGYLRTPNGPTVGGTRLPMALKWAGNAGKFAGRAMFTNPLGLTAGALAWAAAECVEYQGGKWVLTCGTTPPPQSDGLEYNMTAGGSTSGFQSTKQAACEGWAVVRSSADTTYNYQNAQPSPTQTTYCLVDVHYDSTGALYVAGNAVPGLASRASSCPAGWYLTDTGCSQTIPVEELTIDEMADRLANKPLPESGVDWTGWGNPTLPVEQFILNPSPATPPLAQPMRVPQGNPQPVPDTSPQQYQQPMTRITPSPTAGEPLRVDVTGETVTGTDPQGQDGPEPVTGDTPPGTPEEEKNDLCALHPEILACAELDQPVADDLETEERGGPIMPDSGWGAESATCPQPRILTVQGRQIPIPYTLFCTYMEGIRPLVIAMAWLSAGFILLGRKGGD